VEPSGGEETPVVPLTELDSAAILAELAGVYHDLKFVVDVCDRLQQAPANNGSDAILIQALWTAALVAYIRCFTTGVRFRLTEKDLADVPLLGEVREFHRLLKDLRDKHIAHSVNPYETVKVGAVLSPEGGPNPNVEAIATLYARHIAADAQGIQQLRNLASALAHLVAERAQRQTDNVLREARELDVHALYARERLRVNAAGPQDAARRREPHGN
jgi:hypothetical protein